MLRGRLIEIRNAQVHKIIGVFIRSIGSYEVVAGQSTGDGTSTMQKIIVESNFRAQQLGLFEDLSTTFDHYHHMIAKKYLI